jgi:hypothetical protein
MTALHPLASGVEHPSPLRHAASPWLVISGLFAAPAAWSLQLLVSYGLNGDLCSADPATGPVPFGPKAVLLAAIGIVAVAFCVFGFWAAYRTWRLTREEKPGDHHEGLTAGGGRTRFLGLSGMVAAAIFIIAATFALLVPFLESPCVVHLF